MAQIRIKFFAVAKTFENGRNLRGALRGRVFVSQFSRHDLKVDGEISASAA